MRFQIKNTWIYWALYWAIPELARSRMYYSGEYSTVSYGTVDKATTRVYSLRNKSHQGHKTEKLEKYKTKRLHSKSSMLTMEPSTPLYTFMSTLLRDCGCSSIEVTSDNAKTPLNSRTIIVLQDNSSNRPQPRSCRWGNASPAAVTDNIHFSTTLSYDKSSRWENHDVTHSLPYDHNGPSPSRSSRWDLDADRFLNISSPSLPARKNDCDRGVSLKEQAARIARISSRKNLPQSLCALPY